MNIEHISVESPRAGDYYVYAVDDEGECHYGLRYGTAHDAYIAANALADVFETIVVRG